MENITTKTIQTKSEYVKVLSFLVLAGYLSWVCVKSGMTFREQSSEGLFSLLSIFVVPTLWLSPALSIIPKSLFSFVESLSLPWPFFVGGFFIKFVILAILVGVPFFVIYLLARRSFGNNDFSFIQKVFWIVGVIIMLYFLFYPKYLKGQYDSSSGAFESPFFVITQVNKICKNDTDCKNAIYGVLTKNGYTSTTYSGPVKISATSGLMMPSLGSLKEEGVMTTVAHLPTTIRVDYCNTLYILHPDRPVDLAGHSCKERMGD